jgi:hypothetical protein
MTKIYTVADNLKCQYFPIQVLLIQDSGEGLELGGSFEGLAGRWQGGAGVEEL